LPPTAQSGVEDAANPFEIYEDNEVRADKVIVKYKPGGGPMFDRCDARWNLSFFLPILVIRLQLMSSLQPTSMLSSLPLPLPHPMQVRGPQALTARSWEGGDSSVLTAMKV
jgi:hypothetical protein